MIRKKGKKNVEIRRVMTQNDIDNVLCMSGMSIHSSLFFFHSFLKTSQFHDKHNEIFNVHHKQQSF